MWHTVLKVNSRPFQGVSCNVLKSLLAAIRNGPFSFIFIVLQSSWIMLVDSKETSTGRSPLVQSPVIMVARSHSPHCNHRIIPSSRLWCFSSMGGRHILLKSAIPLILFQQRCDLGQQIFVIFRSNYISKEQWPSIRFRDSGAHQTRTLEEYRIVT